MSDVAAIELRGIAKRFGGIHALRGVDLDVPRGCIFGLIGPNGAGKTTLFSVLCGYVRPDAGTVRILGRPPHPAPGAARLATYPQDAQLLPSLSVRNHLVYYARLDGFVGNSAIQEASRVLHLVGLPEAWSRMPRTLSHGMRKRVGICQAFLGRPDVVILDEPVAGLDPDAARAVRHAIRDVGRERTVLVSSHDLDEVQDLCSEVAVLREGSIVRRERTAALVTGRGRVTFKTGRCPEEPLLRELRALPWVRGVEWDEADARLRIDFDQQVKPTEDAARDLVQLLLARGVLFSEMQLGQRLDDVFREETRR